MATPVWQSSRLYPPGSLVQPQSVVPPVSTEITNAGFESGSTDWTLGSGVAITSAEKFTGANSAGFSGTSGLVRVLHASVPCNPGQVITASCYYQQGAASSGQNIGRVVLRWLDAANVLLREDEGTLITSSSGGWKKSTATGKIAPANTAKVVIGGLVNRTASQASWMDAFAWNYAAQSAPSGLVYRAVQAVTGYSGTDEPAWPLTLGLTVVDNEVTWEAVLANRVIWEASPIMLSGAVEPVWPTDVGEFIADNTISWEVISRRVEDEKCPNSKVVAIMAGKVFAGDRDIVRFSATANPLDWTTPDDAGYLPTGLQQANANDVAVLQPYRSNLCPFNASSFQNWQVDPDPAAMAILDQMEGIGSVWQHAAQSVGNELFYLSQRGVRTVGIAAGAENLAAGDVGMPIDPLVQAVLDSTVRPLATYYPSMGQYWLAMRPPLPVAVGPTMSGSAPDGVAGSEYAGFEYTVTPGDAPILSVLLSAGALPTGLEYAAGEILPGIGTEPGTFSFSQKVLDENGIAYTHPDTVVMAPVALGLEWQYTGTFGNNIFDVCAGNGQFLAVGSGLLADGQIWTSPDGDNWVQRTDGQTVQYRSCAFGMVDDVPTWVVSRDSANVLTSNDLVTWTPHTTNNADAYLVTLHDGEQFIRAGTGASSEHSADGISWSSVTRPNANQPNAYVVTEHGGDTVALLFCSSGKIHRTIDHGASWADITVPSDPVPGNNFTGAATDGTTIRAYKWASSVLTTYTSVDGGVTWTWQQDTNGSSNYRAGRVLYRNGNWFGLGASVTGGQQVQLWYSPDGLVPWTAAVVQDYVDTFAATMTAIAASDERAVLVGNKSDPGTSGYAMTSPELTP